MEKAKNRNSNLELLRIISMLLIVAHHYAVHGFELKEIQTVSFNKYIVDILSLGGKIGVCIFVLISGYFMINSKFTIKKMWKIIGQVLFYSLGILILFSTILKPVNQITIGLIKCSVLPITYSAYWFITCYVMLMIISPYLNKFINNLNKTELKNFIILMTFLWSIYIIFTKSKLEFSELGWFIVLYCIAAYIKLYVNLDKKEVKINKIIMFLSIFLLILSSVALNALGKFTGITLLFQNSRYFAKLNSIFTLVISVTMFLHFCSKEKFNNNFINEIAKCTFGVYLIHDNKLFRPYLWKELLKNENYYSSNYLIVHAIISIVCVYIICSIIEFFRGKLIEPLWMKLYEIAEKRIKRR